MSRLTLYSRSYCHLCEDMLHALQRLDSEFSFTVEVIDVDADEQLVAKYDELVPVLVGRHSASGEPGAMETIVQLCHYFLDEAKVREFLAGTPSAVS